MSRQCEMTGKKTTSGQNRPFSLKATKRTFRPNLFTKKMFNPKTGKVEKMKLSAKAIKTLKKWAKLKGKFIDFSAKATTQKKGIDHAAGKGKHVKKAKLTPKQKKELAEQEATAKAEAAKSEADKKMEEKTKSK